MSEKTRYIGSVRFYKNMLLLAIVVLVIGLAALALHSHHRYEQAISLLKQQDSGPSHDFPAVDSDPLA